jgi:hypothetical protein
MTVVDLRPLAAQGFPRGARVRTALIFPTKIWINSADGLRRESVRRTRFVPGPRRPHRGRRVNTGPAITIAVTFVWLGMVLAISFLEAPLKFRAPNVTVQIGLGIGRVVFRALNAVEVAFAVVIVAIVVAGPTPARVAAASSIAVAALVIQLLAVRPRLTRRSDRVLAGVDAPRSRAHYAYLGLEVVKAAALLAAGILLLTA